MGILLGVKKSVAVTLATASAITSEPGRHCPSPPINAQPRDMAVRTIGSSVGHPHDEKGTEY